MPFTLTPKSCSTVFTGFTDIACKIYCSPRRKISRSGPGVIRVYLLQLQTPGIDTHCATCEFPQLCAAASYSEFMPCLVFAQCYCQCFNTGIKERERDKERE